MSKKLNYWINRQNNWIIGRDAKDNCFLPVIDKVNSLIKDKTVLEIGVGTGRYLHLFKDYKYLYGIDFMPKFINTANKIKPNNCELFVDDVVNIQFNKNIDLIFTMVCLQHVDHQEIDLVIKNITNLNSHDIILWECTNDSYNDNRDYMFGHNYVTIFKKYNYKLVSSNLWKNKVTYLLHFTQL